MPLKSPPKRVTCRTVQVSEIRGDKVVSRTIQVEEKGPLVERWRVTLLQKHVPDESDYASDGQK